MKKWIVFINLMFLLVLCACGGETKQDTAAQVSITETVEANEIREYLLADTYPAAKSFSGGDGTEQSPYRISNVAQLAFLEEMLADFHTAGQYDKCYYVLTNDIYINDVTEYETWGEKAPKYSFTPIGIEHGFAGHLNGAGHTIYGLYIYWATPTYLSNAGLFAQTREATICNLNIDKALIINDAKLYGCGTIVGNGNGVIENCNVNAKIMNDYHAFSVGGIAGSFSGGITGCSYSGQIRQENEESETSRVGGIAGIQSAKVQDCYCDADIKIANVMSAGGIAGDSSGTIDTCSFEGRIEASSYVKSVGGIAGEGSGSFNKDINRGKIVLGNMRFECFTGGIVGSYMGSYETINACVNESDLTCMNGSIGGIIGCCCLAADMGLSFDDNMYGTLQISDCTNNGNLSGGVRCGGILGTIREFDSRSEGVVITGCLNNGSINAISGVGGIIGENWVCIENCVIKECKNKGDVNGETQVGGVIGLSYYSVGGTNILSCNNYGDIYSLSGYAGGMVGALFRTIGPDETTQLEFNIEKCINYGSVYAENTVDTVEGIGGIVGTIRDYKNFNLTIKECGNNGNIVWNENGIAGGIVGDKDSIYAAEDVGNIQIMKCYNRGNLIQGTGERKIESRLLRKGDTTKGYAVAMQLGSSSMGGIAGCVSGGTIEECVNTGCFYTDKEHKDIFSFSELIMENNEKIIFIGGIVGKGDFGEDKEEPALSIKKCYFADCVPLGGCFMNGNGVKSDAKAITIEEAEKMIP